MPNSVFLDTSGWLALLHQKDVHHAIASEVWRDLGERGFDIVITDWVIAETGNGLARTKIRHLFSDAVERVWTSKDVQLIVVDRNLIEAALDEYRRYSDKSWGLVDCASFIVMREHGITKAFTSDRHFEQVGFQCVLPTS